MKSVNKYSLILATTLLLPLGAAVADEDSQAAADGERSVEQRVSDAWIAGKLEAVYALNSHLSPFAIETEVAGGMVTLSGVVDNDIDRDLAGELAKGIEGVKAVENGLEVGAGETRAAAEARKSVSAESASGGGNSERKFGAWVDDTTTTAAVKSKLISNGNVAARNIDVTTRYDVVTLTGIVSSDQEKQLAAEIALNTGDVSEVRNELTVE